MALERSWLNVVEVARESRRRFSGRADVMVRLFLVEGHNEGADVQKNEGSGVRFKYGKLFITQSRQHPSVMSRVGGS